VTPLAIAVEQKQWRLVALQLLLGVAEAAEQLPAESLAALLDLLGEEKPPAGESR
jgi:hypothetical protein